LSEETIRKVLKDFGLTDMETEIYFFVSKHGVLKGGEISKRTKIQKAQIYRALKSLQTKGLIESTLEFPARFTAVSLENIIDLSIKSKQEEAAKIAEKRKELLNYWQNIKTTGFESPLERFTVIEGKQKIYHKLCQMMRETKKEILTISSVDGLIRCGAFGVFDAANPHVSFRFIAEFSAKNMKLTSKLFKTLIDAGVAFEGKTPEITLRLPLMTIRDKEEVTFFITPKEQNSFIAQDDVCFWTNCKSLVDAFSLFFEEIWRNSTDIKKKIAEIETAVTAPKTPVESEEKSGPNYFESFSSAKSQILMLTSASDIIDLNKNIGQFKLWAEQGVTVKVMTPIVESNIQAANQLSKFCSIKHVPPNYLPTTIIDGKHMFQFQNSSKKPLLQNQNILFTNDLLYIQKTELMLNEIWKNANPLSTENLRSIFGSVVRIQSSAYFPGAIRSPGPQGTFYPSEPSDLSNKGNYTLIKIVDDDPEDKLTEQDVINQKINIRKNPNKAINVYSNQAIAIFHLPESFDLPPLMIRAHHVEKQSTGGEEDIIMINLWLETPNGPAYVPVALLGDNPTTQEWWKVHFAPSPAGKNVQLAKKDELQVRIHGNTLFAGWTVPIPLLQPKYVLPPACMLIEGYGEVKTSAYTVIGPKGAGFSAKQNGFDAFVTFMHPSTRYSGPGTDGFLVRDFVGNFSPEMYSGVSRTLQHRLVDGKNQKA
jgi:hypothetical protein